MKIVFGGKFESAVIRSLDEANRPSRNRTTHPYYMGLNRDAHKLYFDRAATFLAITLSSVIVAADWSAQGTEEAEGLDASRLGIVHQTDDVPAGGEWDARTKAFATYIVENDVLSPSSAQYISEIYFKHLEPAVQSQLRSHEAEIKKQISIHYLCRLFLQVRATQGRDVLLVLDEEDIELLSQIRDWLIETDSQSPFEFPDLEGKVILGQDFAAGLFNFSPKDARSVVAIREDTTIRDYASTIRYQVYKAQSDDDAQRTVLQAMRETYRKKKAEERINTVFEVAGFVVKPLHYIPIVGEVLTAIEDAKDLTSKVIAHDAATRNWHLLAAKATEINVEEYLSRKSNIV